MDSNHDISALGTWIRVTARPEELDGSLHEVILKEFPTNGNPLTVEDGEAGVLEMDVNGNSYRKAALRPITLSISLIPMSKEDVDLNAVCIDNFGYRYNRFDFDVHYVNGGKEFVEKYSNGILRSVQKGYTYVGEGRLEIRKYVFQFPPPCFQGASSAASAVTNALGV